MPNLLLFFSTAWTFNSRQIYCLLTTYVHPNSCLCSLLCSWESTQDLHPPWKYLWRSKSETDLPFFRLIWYLVYLGSNYYTSSRRTGGAWHAVVYGVSKSQTHLSDLTTDISSIRITCLQLGTVHFAFFISYFFNALIPGCSINRYLELTLSTCRLKYWTLLRA